MSVLDPAACYQALKTRDERFDGRIFVGVTSTGIYCRPVCPARPAKPEHCRFFASAAAAQEAGFRPCLRCRPETAPELGPWRGTCNTVSRGLALIAQGDLDGNEANIDSLAERLGVGGRQLRRLFQQHLGASPIAVAQTRRLLFAKQLIHETHLPMSHVALAAGYGSIRRFNETFRALYNRPPSVLRRARKSERTSGSQSNTGVTVRLRYRAPYDWHSMLSYLAARAVEGIERVEGERYARTVMRHGAVGTVEISHLPEDGALRAIIHLSNVRALPAIVTGIKRAFDLGADVDAIGTHLARDPLLAPLVAARPGLRVPGGWDGFELAVRATLGQQVSVEAGRHLAGQLARLCGTRISPTESGESALTLIFPSAELVLAADMASLGMPNSRKQTLVALARAALTDPQLFQPQDTVEHTVARLRKIRGVGDWTAHIIALRASREPDAFPSSDVALLRAAAGRNGVRPSSEELLARAEHWRPWRAYAAQHLWIEDRRMHHEHTAQSFVR